MSNKDWTDKLPELLDNYTETEPEGLWDAVLAGVSPKKRRIPVAWWYAGGALLAAAAVSAVFFLHPSAPVPTVTVVPGDLVAEAPASPAVEESADQVGNDEVVTVIPGPDAPVIPGTDRESPAIEEEVAEVVEESVVEEVGVEKEVVVEQEVEEKEPVSEPAPVISGSDSPVIPGPDSPVIPGSDRESPPSPRRTVPSLKAQISMSTTGYLGQMATNTFTGVGIPSNPGIRPDAVPVTKSSATGTANATAVPKMLSRNKASTTNALHRQTARTALGIAIGLTEHWGVETGIVSSTLESQFTTDVGNSTSITTRTMKYLGVPLYARYNVLEWKRLSLYLNAGPMYEFSTNTSTQKVDYMSEVKVENQADNTLVEDSVWSINAGGGIQLRIFNHGALYVLPGVSYHFPGDKTLENFYTEHPVSFSLTPGSRRM